MTKGYNLEAFEVKNTHNIRSFGRVSIHPSEYIELLVTSFNPFHNMKTIATLGLVFGLNTVLAAICNNNCGRAVAGVARNNPPFASRSSLCADFVTTYTTIEPA